MVKKATPIYQRILLKLSGEALQGNTDFGINANALENVIHEVKKVIELGVQVGVVVGGGNLFRGVRLVKTGMNRVVSDHIGMLATVINGLAMCDALRSVNIKSHLMSAVSINGICNNYNWAKAIKLLCDNDIVIFVAGTGNPFFTTDSAACLRGIEIKADAVLKGTKVDGVYSADPEQHVDATFYEKLTYQDIIKKELKIMDLSAFSLARDYNLPICVFNINKPNALHRVVMGDKEGTLITHSIDK
ncbi:uridylate kinase [secondary endosymbiont of Heteropsylla cubana]|uniref:Uridylate kinase n=1 Tax=secondary endosymbiont of Heteropsylla cubana TaxID=134287 RepID=J3TGX9_9ENTR|nr:UMP kinase [secondary endosymbiont of Heteropsylla cubana]AFP85787.1 uridylate kinase [secondary endosymbiont of Heteropsylla cubana]